MGVCTGMWQVTRAKESLPIRKPWRIAYLNYSIAAHLNRMCDGSHRRMPCNGSYALYSQGYRPQVREAIWKSLRDSRGYRDEKSTCMVNVCIVADVCSDHPHDDYVCLQYNVNDAELLVRACPWCLIVYYIPSVLLHVMMSFPCFVVVYQIMPKMVTYLKGSCA